MQTEEPYFLTQVAQREEQLRPEEVMRRLNQVKKQLSLEEQAQLL